LSKNANSFTKCFGKNSFKIITAVPGHPFSASKSSDSFVALKLSKQNLLEVARSQNQWSA
jgi:hypothetical protein